MTKFGPEPAQTASHLSHFAARHVFGEMPQRADTSRVRGIHARVRPLLLCCSPRALPTPGCRSGQTPQCLPHPSPPPARSLHPSAPQERSPMAAGALLCALPPSCSSWCSPLCCCYFGREDMARAGRAFLAGSNHRLAGAQTLLLGPRFVLCSRCEAKTHMNSVSGL